MWRHGGKIGLRRETYKIIAIIDIRTGAVYNANGLDIEALMLHRQRDGIPHGFLAVGEDSESTSRGV